MNNIELELEALILEYRLNNSVNLQEEYQLTLDNLNSGMDNLSNNVSLTPEESQAILSELSYPGTYESLDGEISDRFSNVDFSSVAERDLYEQEAFTASLRSRYDDSINNLNNQVLRDELRDEVFTILNESNSINSIAEEIRYVNSQLDYRSE